MKPVAGILEIAPYVGGRASAPGSGRLFKLSSNETPLGPSAAAVDAFRSAADSLHLYPEGSAASLRTAIATIFGIDAARIVCGNGSDELLHLLAQVYVAPGDEVVFSQHGFLVYRIATLAAGGRPVSVPEPNLVTDIDGILRSVTDRTRIVFIANPNNPTGSYNTAAELRRLRRSLPAGCLLAIDAAYAEYADAVDYDSGLELAATTPDTVMTRTFSKVYGLAALRVGWLYGPSAVIDHLNRVRGPFNVSTPAQLAAEAAIRDQDHVRRAVAHNTHWRRWLSERIGATGLRVYPSIGNFLLVAFPGTGAHTAAAADSFLLQRGIVLRPVVAYGLPDCLRITVGSEEANRAAVAALEEFMA